MIFKDKNLEYDIITVFRFIEQAKYSYENSDIDNLYASLNIAKMYIDNSLNNIRSKL